MVHVDVQTPGKLDERQRDLLRELAALRGEELPDGSGAPQGGLLSRVRDVFK
jgi:molecular chaperone DnaJ